MAKLIVLSDGTESDHTLGDGVFTAGSAPDRDLPFTDAPLVSAMHASLRFENSRWFVRDEASTYGTFVNGRRVKEQGLQDGDVLELGLGGPTLRFEAEDDERERSSATTAGRLKQYYEEHQAQPDPEPLEGAGKIAMPVAARGVLFAIGGIALVALGIFWVMGRGPEPVDATGAEAPSEVAPGGALYPVQSASRAYFADMTRMASEVERQRNGGPRRTVIQEELAAVAAAVDAAEPGSTAADSLEERRVSLEARLAVLDGLAEVARDAASGLAIVQAGFQIDSFYFPGPTGTGFLVDGGRLVTSRHLVDPATYIRSAEEADLACALQDLSEQGRQATPVVSVWAPGTTPGRRTDGGLDPATASHSTTAGTLEVVRLLGGQMDEPRLIGCPEGGVVETHHSTDRPGDLALLTLEGGQFTPLPVAASAPASGEMVALAGYPRGAMAGGGPLSPWSTVGPVTGTGSTFTFGAPVLPGADGGPVLDREGRVVGVATSSSDGEGTALGAGLVRTLLGGAP